MMSSGPKGRNYKYTFPHLLEWIILQLAQVLLSLSIARMLPHVRVMKCVLSANILVCRLGLVREAL